MTTIDEAPAGATGTRGVEAAAEAPFKVVLITVTHQVVGASILAWTVALFLVARRLARRWELV